MSFRINISAGELFELISPAVTVISAVVSTWVLASARRRFKLYQALLIATASFFLPLIVVPLYLVALLVWQRRKIASPRWRFVIPLAFLTVILGTLALYRYLDERSVDSHLSRAALARVSNNPTDAVREYQAVLKLEETAHTRKLLALTLEEAGLIREAIAEFRNAEQEGEQDDSIAYRLGLLFERDNQKGQSITEFKRFVGSNTCKQIDPRCEAARQRIDDFVNDR